MLKNLQNLMLVTLLALTAQQVSCADQKTASLASRVWDGAKGMVTWTGDQAAAVGNSFFGSWLRGICEPIAGVTILATIQKVGIRSTARMLASKPMVFPVACYSLALLVRYMSFREIHSESGCPKERRDPVLRNWKCAEALSLVSALCFLTLAQPLAMSLSPAKIAA